MKIAQLIRALALVATAGATGLAGAQAVQSPGIVRTTADIIKAAKCGNTAAPPAAGTVESAFSPDGGADALVLKVIQSARQSIRMAAYALTSPAVVRALVEAKRQGVDVAVVADYRQNITEDKSGAARAALNLLVNAGIPVSMVSAYAAHHDKYIVVDAVTLETGSFNYSEAATKRNSENVLVIWSNPQVAAPYLHHWQSRYERGTAYASTY